MNTQKQYIQSQLARDIYNIIGNVKPTPKNDRLVSIRKLARIPSYTLDT